MKLYIFLILWHFKLGYFSMCVCPESRGQSWCLLSLSCLSASPMGSPVSTPWPGVTGSTTPTFLCRFWDLHMTASTLCTEHLHDPCVISLNVPLWFEGVPHHLQRALWQAHSLDCRARTQPGYVFMFFPSRDISPKILSALCQWVS